MFVEDVAKANVLVAEKEEANYQVFNVGTGIATTVLDFISCLARVYGYEVTPELRGEYRPGDVRHLVTDATRLKALGWKPEVLLEEGLQLYSRWMQRYSSIEEYFTEAEQLLKTTHVVMQST
jgi:dTDP-L-rhamnose 4-epimerase